MFQKMTKILEVGRWRKVLAMVLTLYYGNKITRNREFFFKD